MIHGTIGAEANRPIKFIMDDREPRDLMLSLLERCECFEVSVQRLRVGDYMVADALLIERKTFPDLVESIIDGRLFGQALRLAEADIPAALILEGSLSDLKDSQMRWEAVQGAMVTIALFIGLPILRTRSPQETINTIAYAARQRAAGATGALTRRARRPKGRAALQSYILQGLPGVGPKRAKQLLARFGNVETVIGASAEALRAIDGLGPETIQRIRAAVS